MSKIKKLLKIKESEYLINELVHLKINEDSTLTVGFDEKDISEGEVYDLVREFFNI